MEGGVVRGDSEYVDIRVADCTQYNARHSLIMSSHKPAQLLNWEAQNDVTYTRLKIFYRFSRPLQPGCTDQTFPGGSSRVWMRSIRVTLTSQPSPPDQVFWTKRKVYYQPTINLAESLPICVRQMEA